MLMKRRGCGTRGAPRADRGDGSWQGETRSAADGVQTVRVVPVCVPSLLRTTRHIITRSLPASVVRRATDACTSPVWRPGATFVRSVHRWRRSVRINGDPCHHGLSDGMRASI